jgi:ankyrin repeat protein
MQELEKKLFELFYNNAKRHEIINFVKEHKENLDLHARDHIDRDILVLAIFRSDLKLVNFLLYIFPEMIDNISKAGVHAIHVAAQKGNIAIIKTLLDHGADINLPLPSRGDATPLTLAVQKQQLEAVKFLSQSKGINLEAEFRNVHYTALHIAISYSDNGDHIWLNIAAQLIDSGASIKPNFHKEDDKYFIIDPMHIAINALNPKMVSLLLDRGYKDHFSTDLYEETKICSASILVVLAKLVKISGNEHHSALLCSKIVTMLINSQNIDFDFQDSHGRTPLMLAFAMGNIGIAAAIEMIKNKRCNFEIKDKNGKNIYDHIRTFLEQADNSAINNLYLTEAEAKILLNFTFPEESAAKQFICSKLEKFSGNFFFYYKNNYYFIHQAFSFLGDAKHNPTNSIQDITKQRMLEHLIEYINLSSIENLNQDIGSGYTLLQLAMHYDSYGAFKILLTKGVAIDAKSDHGHNALHTATLPYINNIYLELLIDHILNNEDLKYRLPEFLKMQTLDGDNILIFAMKNYKSGSINNFEKIQILLNMNLIDINQPDKFGLRPIDIAILQDSLNLTHAILNYAPNLCQNSQKMTPLHYAAAMGNIDISCLIYQQHPNALYIQDSCGRTPLHHAAVDRSLDIIQLLSANNRNILEIQDNNGYTILHQIILTSGDIDSEAYWDRVDSIFGDLEHLEITDNQGFTPLELAAFLGKKYPIQYLSALIDIPLTQNILTIAVAGGYQELIQYLVDDSAMDLSQRDDAGCTPFFNLVYLYRHSLHHRDNPDNLYKLKSTIQFLFAKYPEQLGLETEYEDENALDILEDIARQFGEYFMDKPQAQGEAQQKLKVPPLEFKPILKGCTEEDLPSTLSISRIGSDDDEQLTLTGITSRETNQVDFP